MSEKIISEDKPGFNTRREIFQQPGVWGKTFELILSQKDEITDFFRRLPGEDVDMILTGAGSSAFIGNAVFGSRIKVHGKGSRVVPTTELITHPEYFLEKNKTLVLVSFARSGNSPESLAAVDIVNAYCKKAYHVIITCNENGDLCKKTGSGILKVLLPPETNDVSLAMTSSFSSMMLAFILINRIETLEKERDNVRKLSEWGDFILNNFDKPIKEVASRDFSRAVFLGSGPLRGTAEESHLKLQELTDGAVICAFNSFLGFRHGPRAVVNDATLLVYLFDDDEHTRKYEFDLVRQINAGIKGLAQISVAHKPVSPAGITFDLSVCFGKESDDDAIIEYLCVAEVLVAQLLGFHKSISFGLDPDNPSRSGAISRVVEGVKIYNYDFKKING